MNKKKIQKIKTDDGFMIPIYRDWDSQINEGHVPKMVYSTVLNPGVAKDIIYHERRTSYITCVFGEVVVETLENGVLDSSLMSTFDYECVDLLIVGKSVPLRIINSSNTSHAVVINCPSPSWHPDDQDTIKFKSWEEFKRWKAV